MWNQDSDTKQKLLEGEEEKSVPSSKTKVHVQETPAPFPKKEKAKDAKAEKKAQELQAGLQKAEKFKAMREHKIPIEELFAQMQSDPERGLSSAVAVDRNKIYGDNVLTGKKKTPWYVKLLIELVTPFALILWVGAILSIVVYFIGEPPDPSNLYLGGVLIAIIVVSALGSFIQNYKSEAIMENFKNFIPPQATVIRDGEQQRLGASTLVPGDILIIKEGDKIPADIRVITCTEMRVDNSSLTGESDPLLRSPHPPPESDDNPLEAENLCFFGTLCRQGSCKGIVLQIGDNTVIGQIAHLATTADAGKTPLQIEMDRFVIIIAIIAVTMGLAFFVAGFFLGYNAIANLIFAVGLITGNAPEGLLVFVTVLLTVCAKRMASKQVLAKNLQSVETLGATTCICSDNTGTLTQNRMTVENVWYDGKVHRAINRQKFPETPLEYKIDSLGFKTLHDVAVLSSQAQFDFGLPEEKRAKIRERFQALGSENNEKLILELEKAGHEYKAGLEKKLWLDIPVIGDASETALVRFFQAIEDIKITRARHPLAMVNGTECRVAFNSTNKFALSIVEYPTPNSHYCMLIKGAPERIWAYCTHIAINGKEERIEQWQKQYDITNERFGKGGERVLGFAKLHLPESKFPKGYQFNTSVAAKRENNYAEWNFPLGGMTFAGLVSLIDPPRDAVPYSIIKCKTAGIKVIMVTGDQPVTAAAIARQVNIIDRFAETNIELQEKYGYSKDEAIAKAESIVIHGDQLTEASREDEALPIEQRGQKLKFWLTKKQIVFARTSPAQKLIIVNGCQELNHIVAVTGDGVNDSPAIKKADIGIAMGVTGSDVAKDAADLVLLTDDFSSLIVGIEEGRKLYDNLKKCISYSLTTNIPEIVPFMILIIFKTPLPVTTVLLLCLSIGTDMFPAISFAYEEPELDIMIKKPRDREEHLVTKKLLTMSYLQIGIFESFAAFLTYFTIMNDFGFPFWSLFGLGLKQGYPSCSKGEMVQQPNGGQLNCEDGDVYDPYDPFLGNSLLQNACTNGMPS